MVEKLSNAMFKHWPSVKTFRKGQKPNFIEHIFQGKVKIKKRPENNPKESLVLSHLKSQKQSFPAG